MANSKTAADPAAVRQDYRKAVKLVARAFKVRRAVVYGARWRKDGVVAPAGDAALYLTVVTRDHGVRPTSRATRRAHVSVLRAVRRAEDRRDDPVFDRTLSRLEQEMVA